MPAQVIDKLRAIARNWGGEVIMLDDDRDFNRVFSGPCANDPYPTDLG